MGFKERSFTFFLKSHHLWCPFCASMVVGRLAHQWPIIAPTLALPSTSLFPYSAFVISSSILSLFAPSLPIPSLPPLVFLLPSSQASDHFSTWSGLFRVKYFFSLDVGLWLSLMWDLTYAICLFTICNFFLFFCALRCEICCVCFICCETQHFMSGPFFFFFNVEAINHSMLGMICCRNYNRRAT